MINHMFPIDTKVYDHNARKGGVVIGYTPMNLVDSKYPTWVQILTDEGLKYSVRPDLLESEHDIDDKYNYVD